MFVNDILARLFSMVNPEILANIVGLSIEKDGICIGKFLKIIV